MRILPSELLQRALYLEDCGDIDGAIKLLADAIPLAVYSGDVRWRSVLSQHLSILCERTGRLGLAVECLRNSLVEAPHDIGVLYNLARFLVLTGRRDEALVVAETFRRACDRSTEDLVKGWVELLPALDKMLSDERMGH